MYIICEMNDVLGHEVSVFSWVFCGKNTGNHKILLTYLMASVFIVVFLKMLLFYTILLSSRNCTQKNFFIGRHRGQEIPQGSCKNSFTLLGNRRNKEAKQFTRPTSVGINKIVNIGTMHACKILNFFSHLQQH